MKTNFVMVCFLMLAAIVSMQAQQIGTGLGDHTIVVKNSGRVYTWGYNGDGELGNGNYSNSNVPVAVDTSGVLSGKTITRVATGNTHSIALASDGRVYTWGDNSSGQLGNGDTTNSNSNVPVAVDTSGVLSGKTITRVAAGYTHSIVLASDGTVYTWGYNFDGELGNGSNADSNVPVAVYTSGVLSGKTITQVAAGGSHSIALASDGTIYTWGYNGDGELGNGNYSNSNVPVAVDTSGMGALPVELVWFNALSQGSGVALNWQTATEVNNYGFEIERAIDNGKLKIDNWEKIGFVEGSGNSNSPKEYSYTDKNLSSGKYLYRLKQIDRDGKFEYSQEVEVVIAQTPQKFALMQNYPNPFNPTTTIQYSVGTDAHPSNNNMHGRALTTLKIYDVLGREVATLVNEVKEAGNYSVQWNASKFSSGIYYARLQSGEQVQMKKMVLLR